MWMSRSRITTWMRLASLPSSIRRLAQSTRSGRELVTAARGTFFFRSTFSGLSS